MRHIAIIGEEDTAKTAHQGIRASMTLFQRDFEPTLRYTWIPTREIAAGQMADLFRDVTGVWCAPGSPYECTDGALRAIRFARENSVAFLGTCGGFQHALMEFAGNVLARNSQHAELDPGAVDPLIVKLSCSLIGAQGRVIASRGSRFAAFLGGAESVEEFNCNYGVRRDLEGVFDGSSLEFVARDQEEQPRAFLLADHPFFVGTLFQPERRALRGSLHPVVRAFLNQAGR